MEFCERGGANFTGSKFIFCGIFLDREFFLILWVGENCNGFVGFKNQKCRHP